MLTVDERRTITVPVPADKEVVEQLAVLFTEAAEDGFTVVDAHTREIGNQRDPVVNAVVIGFRKTGVRDG